MRDDGRVSGSHGHGHGHGGAAVRAGARHLRRLRWAFALIAVFFVVEVVGGVLTNSLALLSDAGHMLTDLVGMGMALAAIGVANRRAPAAHRTFGLYRLEILAALANAVLLAGVGGYVVVEAVRRVADPAEVLAGEMFVVALAGLVVNVVALLLLREGSAESLNVKGAYLEVLADLVSSVGVVVAAVVVGLTGWSYADPIVAAGVGLFIFPRTFRLGAEAVRILVQAAPPGMDLERLRADLAALPGVVDVHDLHVWTLTSDMEVASAHLMVREGTDAHGVLDRARVLLAETHGLHHATLQVEPESHRGCDELSW